ncbi:MAG TPA: DUF1565 domain-containing protein [Beijerinckiaceae bacterium]|nr:DUF1565 domain-containing protein [Beijerinckiaceae bacterium]
MTVRAPRRAVVAAMLAAAASPLSAATFHISPAGSDDAAGSAAAPWRSIQRGLAAAEPGDVVALAPGRYLQDVRSVRAGNPGQPIVMRGPREAVVSGAGAPRMVEINHGHIELRGFTLDGHHAAEQRPDSYRDKLLYVIGTRPRDGVEGLKVIGMAFRNGGGECIRLRYFAQNNEIAHSTFEGCGVHDFQFRKSGKNGEAIYIGTAPEQLGDRGAPDASPDQSNGNWIHHNTFDTRGNECVDIKEASSKNVVEHNRCTGQLDKNSGGLGSRGSGNVFRYNLVYGNRGAGIRVGGDGERDGIDNDIYGNTFRDNAMGPIRAQRGPQGKVCENVAERNGEAPESGRFTRELVPAIACSDPLATPAGRRAKVEAAAEVAEKPKNAEPLRCAAAGLHCVVARFEGDERNRIKILDASDPSLRGKHLIVQEASDQNARPLDPKALAGKIARIEFQALDKRVLQNARVVRVLAEAARSAPNSVLSP